MITTTSPKITLLSLNGLSCMKCVGRVDAALDAFSCIQEKKISKHYAKILHNCDIQALIKAIEDAGYHASIADKPDFSLTLSGLHCKNCLNKVTKLLSEESAIVHFDVSLTKADIWGEKKAQEIIQSIDVLGFTATVDDGSQQSTSETLCQSNSEKIPSQPKEELSSIINDKESAQTHQLLLRGLSCASCVSKVEKALKRVDGVTQANVSLAQSAALIKGDVSSKVLIDAVQQAGYQAELIIDEKTLREKQQQYAKRTVHKYKIQSAISLVFAVPLMAWGMLTDNMMVDGNNQITWITLGIITLIIMIFSGEHFFKNAWHSLTLKTTTMDTLVALSTGVAWIYSFSITLFPSIFPTDTRHVYYEASLMIIGLINLGHVIEAKARYRSSNALEKLIDLTPPTARQVLSTNEEQVVPLAKVSVGMILRVITGDRVPVDGKITEGEIWVNEAMLTGESQLQHKKIGDKLHAGTTIDNGNAQFEAVAVGEQTILSHIITLVRQAQTSKPDMAKLADKVAAVFVPAVIIIAIISALIWLTVGPAPRLSYSFIILTTVLIIACPCALGLATPMSIIAGIGRAAEFGILIRDANALEKGSQITTLVFDKTGTLTEGKPQVIEIKLFNHFEEKDVINLAKKMEQHANHPLAKAILDYPLEVSTINKTALEQVEIIKGSGIQALIENQTVLLGNQTLMKNHQISLVDTDDIINATRQQGATLVFLAINNQLAAIFIIQDKIRSESTQVLSALKNQGYRLVMLTGDHQTTANYFAKQLGLTEVIADVLPHKKADAIKSLQEKGEVVAMIGDGINDAPALAQADVGIAMASGSDIAIETAGITLMRSSLEGVYDALQLSKGTLRNMKQNLWGAFIYNIFGIPIAAGVLFPFTGLLLSPIIAAAAMALSSITVVSNANRLLLFKPKKEK